MIMYLTFKLSSRRRIVTSVEGVLCRRACLGRRMLVSMLTENLHMENFQMRKTVLSEALHVPIRKLPNSPKKTVHTHMYVDGRKKKENTCLTKMR